MLVTFKTTAYADITMFGDAASDLMVMMGLSGNIPGALMGDDVPGALAALRTALEAQPDTTSGNNESEDDDDASNKVALATRAVPLIELLEAAEAAGANVMWDK